MNDTRQALVGDKLLHNAPLHNTINILLEKSETEWEDLLKKISYDAKVTSCIYSGFHIYHQINNALIRDSCSLSWISLWDSDDRNVKQLIFFTYI